ETQARAHEARAQPQAARLRMDDQQPQFRNRRGFPDEKDRTHDLSILLGNPGALALFVEIAGELRDDVRDQRLEGPVVAEFARVELAVELHHASEVAGPGTAEPKGSGFHECFFLEYTVGSQVPSGNGVPAQGRPQSARARAGALPGRPQSRVLHSRTLLLHRSGLRQHRLPAAVGALVRTAA